MTVCCPPTVLESIVLIPTSPAVEATWRMAHGTMNADEMLHSVKESLAVGRSLHRRGLSAEGRLFPCANDTLYTISLVAADWRRLGQGYGGFVG
jgi:hypothetical protein